jgi:hypothetical protein
MNATEQERNCVCFDYEVVLSTFRRFYQQLNGEEEDSSNEVMEELTLYQEPLIAQERPIEKSDEDQENDSSDDIEYDSIICDEYDSCICDDCDSDTISVPGFDYVNKLMQKYRIQIDTVNVIEYYYHRQDEQQDEQLFKSCKIYKSHVDTDLITEPQNEIKIPGSPLLIQKLLELGINMVECIQLRREKDKFNAYYKVYN